MTPIAPSPVAAPPPAPASAEGLTLGGLSLQSRFLLAPLEGVSDAGFRRLCFEQGAGLTFTEMLRAKALARRNKSTLDLIDTVHADVPTGIQLLATSAKELSDAIAVVDELAGSSHPHFQNICSVDLNFGCPSREIVQVGAGPAMLKRRAKLQSIVEALKALKTSTKHLKIQAVSIKIRLGLNAKEASHKVYIPVVEMASAVGLDWITIHARHAGQRSRDPAIWSAIAEAKAASGIPVIGNGDVRTADDAQRLFAETGCDGALIARAAIHSPFVFRSLRGRGAPFPSPDEVDVERTRYLETAARLQTKPKYQAFHEEGFARLGQVARGVTVREQMPRNAHM